MRPQKIAQSLITLGGVKALCLIHHSPETLRDASLKVLLKGYQVSLKRRMTGVLNGPSKRQNRTYQNARDLAFLARKALPLAKRMLGQLDQSSNHPQMKMDRVASLVAHEVKMRQLRLLQMTAIGAALLARGPPVLTFPVRQLVLISVVYLLNVL